MLSCSTLFSGSSGNSIYCKCDSTEILIDCGVSMKRIETALRGLDTSLGNIRAIFITHEHSDHVQSLSMIAKHYDIPIYITPACAEEVYSAALCKGACKEADCLKKNIRTIAPQMSYQCGDAVFMPFSTPHDSRDSVGYVIGTEVNEKQLGIATDIGHVSDEVRAALCGCNKVIIESNHDVEMLRSGPYPELLKRRILSPDGHLSNDDCADFLPVLLSSGCEEFALFHLSRDNNLPSVAENTAERAFITAGAKRMRDYRLTVAGRSEVTTL
ncbi:MAG: MBL fold metallo-hydrolase [Firmicutes bacterium]|nr:MBL fold metallo-hydrolase [Bacillota bacterium]